MKGIFSALKDLFSTFKLLVAIVSFTYAITFSILLFIEGKKDIQGISDFLYNNNIQIIAISVSTILYIVLTLFLNYKVLVNMVRSDKISIFVTVILTLLMLVFVSWTMYQVTKVAFSVFYAYSTKKMHFLFFVLYYATFVGFLFVIRDLLEVLGEKCSKVLIIYRGRYILFFLILVFAQRLANYLDKSELKRPAIEAIFTGISSVMLVLTISVCFYLSFERQRKSRKNENVKSGD